MHRYACFQTIKDIDQRDVQQHREQKDGAKKPRPPGKQQKGPRDLAEGETILVKPPALLFKDPSVAMQLHIEYPSAGMRFWRSWGNRYLWLRLWGPGRVGLESAYVAADDPGTTFNSMSSATQHSW